jgi:hypothetical protein
LNLTSDLNPSSSFRVIKIEYDPSDYNWAPVI